MKSIDSKIRKILNSKENIEPIELVEFLGLHREEPIDPKVKEIAKAKVLERYEPFNQWLNSDDLRKFHAKHWNNLAVRAMTYDLDKEIKRETAKGLILIGLIGYYSHGWNLHFAGSHGYLDQNEVDYRSKKLICTIDPAEPMIKKPGSERGGYYFIDGESIGKIISLHNLSKKEVLPIYEKVITTMEQARKEKENTLYRYSLPPEKAGYKDLSVGCLDKRAVPEVLQRLKTQYRNIKLH